MDHAALRLIYLQLELPAYESGDAFLYSVARALAFDIDDTVIGKAYELQSALFEWNLRLAPHTTRLGLPIALHPRPECSPPHIPVFCTIGPRFCVRLPSLKSFLTCSCLPPAFELVSLAKDFTSLRRSLS